MWSLAAEAVLSVLTYTLLPSLADTSGLSSGAIPAEPLLYPPSCASTPRGTEYGVLLQLFEKHNSTIHSNVRQQQHPLLSAGSDSYKAWLKAASVAAGVVQLLYQAFNNIDHLTSSDNQEGESGQVASLECVSRNTADMSMTGLTSVYTVCCQAGCKQAT
jgi:hypothetical protein